MASAEAPPPSMLQAVPAQLANHLEGDPKAQALSYQLSSVDKQLGYRFFTEERRSWVMSLPTESGEKVLKALCVSGLHVEADLASRLQTLCKRWWYVLARFLAAKTTPVQFCIDSASGGLGVSAESPMPEELEAIPSWYEEQWESKFRIPQQKLKKLNEAAWNPGRTWRSGLAGEMFGQTPQFEYYPGGEVGRQEQKVRKSKRQKTDNDKIRPGEYYKAPADEPDRLVDAIDRGSGCLVGLGSWAIITTIPTKTATEDLTHCVWTVSRG